MIKLKDIEKRFKNNERVIHNSINLELPNHDLVLFFSMLPILTLLSKTPHNIMVKHDIWYLNYLLKHYKSQKNINYLSINNFRVFT